MSKRNKILLSITGIILTLILVLGVAYAYYRTRVIGNENETSISVTSKNMILKYGDGNGVITFSNLNPGDKIEKTFTVTNEGNVKAEYVIYLENIVNNLEYTEDLVYTITCVSGDCSNVSETEFQTKNTSIVTEVIEANKTNEYKLTITYLAQPKDQSIDMNKKISAKINIYDPSVISEDTGLLLLSNQIMNDTRIIKNTTVPTFSTSIDKGELGLFTVEDDYGTSYYFRGTQSYNYVNFAGFTWRVVRINGDGSIRLILADTIDKAIREGENNYAGSLVAFNKPYGDNAYIGYMYGTPGSSTYEETHQNINSSVLKQEVDKFYENYIENDTKNYHYEEYLADSIFCGDKTLANANTSDDNTALGYGNNKTYYGAVNRVYYLTKGSSLTKLTPTMKCAEGATDSYSRYTADEQTTSLTNVKTNGDLTYPIGLLSVDEAIYAGASTSPNSNSTNYLVLSADKYDNNLYWWWTMTGASASLDDTTDAGFDSTNYDTCNSDNTVCYTSNAMFIGKYARISSDNADVERAVRPVINLKSNVSITSGDGTVDGPYIIKTN